jgi:hypothetical protein
LKKKKKISAEAQRTLRGAEKAGNFAACNRKRPLKPKRKTTEALG